MTSHLPYNPLQHFPSSHLCIRYMSFLPLMDLGKDTAHQLAHTGSCQDNHILAAWGRRMEEMRKRSDRAAKWKGMKNSFMHVLLSLMEATKKVCFTCTSLACLVVIVGTQATGPPNGIKMVDSSRDTLALTPKRSTCAWSRGLRIATTSFTATRRIYQPSVSLNCWLRRALTFRVKAFCTQL